MIEFQHNGKNYSKAAINGTSNIPKNLTDSQFQTEAMKNLMKANSTNPGSIITTGNYTFKKIDNEIKYIPNWQLQHALYVVEINNWDIFEEWDSKFMEILNTSLAYIEHKEYIQKLSSGYFNIVFEADRGISDDEIFETIRNEMRNL